MNKPSYIRYEHHERHQMVDRIIRDSHEVLMIPSVAALLGVRATQLAMLLDVLSAPNIRHGVIHSGASRQQSIDIVALHANEQILRPFENSAWSEVQEQRVREDIPHAEWLIGVQAQHYRQNKHSTLPTFNDHPSAVAQVFSANLPMQTTLGTVHLRGRPLVVARADDLTWHHPAFILHELTHVQQIHDDPLIGPRNTPAEVYLHEESEAYSVAAQIIRGQQRASSTLLRLNDSIEQELLRLDECAN